MTGEALRTVTIQSLRASLLALPAQLNLFHSTGVEYTKCRRSHTTGASAAISLAQRVVSTRGIPLHFGEIILN